MFMLPPGKSISGLSTHEQLLNFILKLFYQTENLTLTYQSLCVIDRLLVIPFIDVSFIGTDDFFSHSISLINHPNRELAHMSLNTLVNYIDNNRRTFPLAVSRGLLDSLFRVSTLDTTSDPPETINNYLLTTFYSMFKLEPLLYSPQQQELFWSLSVRLITENVHSKYIRNGLVLMQCLLAHMHTPTVTDEFYATALALADAPGEVLDALFALITHTRFPDPERLFAHLRSGGFFAALLRRTDDEPDVAHFLFKLLDAVSFVPGPQDAALDCIVATLSGASYRARISCLRYVHTLVTEDPSLAPALAARGAIAALAEIIAGRDSAFLSEGLALLSRLFAALAARGEDPRAYEGAAELADPLCELADEAEFARTAEEILSYYADEPVQLYA